MKVAILCESPSDEAAIRILADGILGIRTERASAREARGWPSVRNILPVVIPQLYYHTDADALIVIGDSDDSLLHHPSHNEIGAENPLCRVCQLRAAIDLQLSRLRPVQGRPEIKTAIGLAVPAIEAWYRCDLDPQVNEAAWARKLKGEACTYTRKTLKRDVYGTDRPSMEIEINCATQAASRMVTCVPLLEQLFPNGFGAFANDLRGW
jgi:hypothetical protein